MPSFVLTSSDVGAHASVLTCSVAADVTRTVVHLSGELDVVSAPLLVLVLTGLAEHGQVDVHLDLTGLRFCGVRGLAAPRQTQEVRPARGGRLVLLSASPFLQRVAGVCGLAALFATAA